MGICPSNYDVLFDEVLWPVLCVMDFHLPTLVDCDAQVALLFFIVHRLTMYSMLGIGTIALYLL